MFNVQLQEHLDSVLATPQTADLEYARNVGREQPQRAWILSDRDCWYPNPFYTGPKVRHPEDDCYDDEEPIEQAAATPAEFEGGALAPNWKSSGDDLYDSIPF